MLHTMLKIKLKSLAEEARIIRHQEKKMRGKNWGRSSNQFNLHRLLVVRPEARATHLAYGFLRGLEYNQMEATHKTEPNWKSVERMVKKYGTLKDELRFESWKKGVSDKLAA